MTRPLSEHVVPGMGGELDISLVAGRRPDLLARTLESFSDRVFRYFHIGRAHVNIDPIFGNDEDHAECRHVVDRYLPGATVFEPAEPSFGAAVKRLWAATVGSGLLLHLEDDWVVLDDIPPAKVVPMFDDSRVMAAVPLAIEHDRPAGTEFNVRKITDRWHGFVWRRRLAPRFGTSPQFLRSNFAREVSGLLDPAMDPEKQMRDNRNPALERYHAQFRCRIISGPPSTGFLIQDIGRAWRTERGIQKVVRNGATTWTD